MIKRSIKIFWDVVSPMLLYYSIAMLLAYSAGLAGLSRADNFVLWLTLSVHIVAALPLGLSLYADKKKEAGLIGYAYTEGFTDNTVDKAYRRLGFRDYILIIIFAISLSNICNVLIAMTSLDKLDEGFRDVNNAIEFAPLYLQLLTAGFTAPIIEEVIFRALIYKRFRRVFAIPFSIFSSAFLFGIFHGNIVQAVYAFVIGCFIAYLYEKTNSLRACIVFHMAANLFAILGSGTGLFEFLGESAVVSLIFIFVCIVLFIFSLNYFKRNNYKMMKELEEEIF